MRAVQLGLRGLQEAAAEPASWELYIIFTHSYKIYKLGLLSLELTCMTRKSLLQRKE